MLSINFIKKNLLGLLEILIIFKSGFILKLNINPAKILEYINLILAVP